MLYRSITGVNNGACILTAAERLHNLAAPTLRFHYFLFFSCGEAAKILPSFFFAAKRQYF
jgi:hypothetical protein